MTQRPFRLLCRSAVALAVLWAMTSASPAGGAPDPDDTDADGVTDTVDLCLDTPPLDLVDAEGCSVCPCDTTADGDVWASHDAYVACVTTEAHARRSAHTMKRRAMRAAVRRARNASCGNAALTRCCVYVHLDLSADTNVGECRMISAEECDALTEQVDWSEDVGGGSCTPNPCQF